MDKIKENYQVCVDFLTKVETEVAKELMEKIKSEKKETTSD